MKKISTQFLLSLLFLMTSNLVAAFPGEQWEKAADSVEINPILLYAVALAESASHRGAQRISPWPYAIRVGDDAVYAKSKAEAEAVLNRALKEKKKHHLDVGLMQINLHWHGSRVDSPTALLDPVTNLNLGSRILAEAIASSPTDLELGIGRYHSWKEERARWYGKRVLMIYQNLLKELEVHQ